MNLLLKTDGNFRSVNNEIFPLHLYEKILNRVGIHYHRIMERRKVVFGFAYDGTSFSSYQSHNSFNTVEGGIRSEVTSNLLGENMRTASRTDKNVSALFNAMSLDTTVKPEDTIGILNSNLENIYFHSYGYVSDDFNVRHCSEKEYTYLLPFSWVDIDEFIREMKKFIGKHDFAKFCRYDNKETIREINSIDTIFWNGMPGLVFRARGFLWNQIRFIVGYGIKRQRDGAEPEDPWSDQNWSRYLAPAELLFLTKIKYEGVDMKRIRSRSMEKKIEILKRGTIARNYFFNHIP